MYLATKISIKNLLSLLGFFFISLNAQSDDTIDLSNLTSNAVSENTARSIVLSDANLVTLGVMDFDPNEFVDLDNINTGDESSLETRSQLSMYSLPWNFSPLKINTQLTSQTQLRLSYISSEKNLTYSDTSIGNPLDETTYLLYAENNWKYQYNEYWAFQTSIGSEILFYENTLVYRDLLLKQLSSYLDGALVNTSYNALTIDPSIGATYEGEFYGTRWEYKAIYRYALGKSFNTRHNKQNTTVKAGRLSNSVTFHIDTPDVLNRQSQFRVLARRIDLGGDTVEAMGTRSYYELGAGWLIDTSKDMSFLKNIGIGISINIDSNLSGGSVVILFNEKI